MPVPHKNRVNKARPDISALSIWCLMSWIVGRQVLVVQEKIGILRGTGLWKIPTGMVDEVNPNTIAQKVVLKICPLILNDIRRDRMKT